MPNMKLKIGLVLALLAFSGLCAVGVSASRVIPTSAEEYRHLVENRDRLTNYVDQAWSTFDLLEHREVHDVRVTVTLSRSHSVAETQALADRLGISLSAWDAMIGRGTMHVAATGPMMDDAERMIERLQRDLDPNLSVADAKVVALFGTMRPDQAKRMKGDPAILLIDPSGDRSVTGAKESRFSPHLFWTLPDYRNK
jgi:hypothetical protein